MLIEDVPQLALGSIYVHYMNKANRELPEKYREPVDPVAIVSLVMSVIGLLANLALTLAPKLVFKMVDQETGKRRPSIRAGSIKIARRKSGTLANQSFTTVSDPFNVFANEEGDGLGEDGEDGGYLKVLPDG